MRWVSSIFLDTLVVTRSHAHSLGVAGCRWAASTLDYAIETAVEELALAKEKLIALDVVRDSPNAMFAVWSAFAVVLVALACVWTATVDPLAAGSGIPEMKTIISCDLQREADRHLGARTLVSKAGGLTLALASGISIGREGPFVHLAAIIAHQLMKNVGFFRRIYANDILRRHMYNAACAVGVASTFRAPVGGVLLSIEVTSTVFMLSVRTMSSVSGGLNSLRPRC